MIKLIVFDIVCNVDHDQSNFNYSSILQPSNMTCVENYLLGLPYIT